MNKKQLIVIPILILLLLPIFLYAETDVLRDKMEKMIKSNSEFFGKVNPSIDKDAPDGAVYWIKIKEGMKYYFSTNKELDDFQDALEAEIKDRKKEADTYEAKKSKSYLEILTEGISEGGRSIVSDVREISYQKQEPKYKPIYQVSQRKPTFSNGYKGGYIDGYQYTEGGGIKPIAPIAPISPIPNIGEKTYEDGYTRGIIEGQR